MRIGPHHFRRMEPRTCRNGETCYYWAPPPGPARDVFTTESLGKTLDANALKIYAQREESYKQWLAERAADAASGQAPPAAGSIDWMLERYEGSSHWPPGEKSRQDYHNKLMFLRNWRGENGRRLGSLPWLSIRGKHSEALYKNWIWRDDGTQRVSYAGAVVRQARAAWNWAMGEYDDQWGGRGNPWKHPRIKTTDPRTVKWEPWEVRSFCETAEAHQRLSLAMAAMFSYELGQRIGDARRAMRSQFAPGRVRVVQHKTDTELLLPVSATLKEWIDKISPDQMQLVLNERTGKPYKDYELSKAAAEIREAAGLPSHLYLMDLRRTMVSALGDLGATEDELISVGGWRDRQMVSVYSVKSYQRALRAMSRWWEERKAA
jgi:hypothetical protein